MDLITLAPLLKNFSIEIINQNDPREIAYKFYSGDKVIFGNVLPTGERIPLNEVIHFIASAMEKKK